MYLLKTVIYEKRLRNIFFKTIFYRSFWNKNIILISKSFGGPLKIIGDDPKLSRVL